MPTSISDVMGALEQLLLEHFKSINSGSAAQPFLAFESGTPIPDETFRNPVDPTRYSPALALEYLSHRANVVPSIVKHEFVETSKTVAGQYEILLRGSTPVDAAQMELVGAIKRGALSAFDDVLQAESGVSEPFRPTRCDPADWYDQSVTSNWTPIKIDRSDKPATLAPQASTWSNTLLQWKLAPVELRSQLGDTASLTSMRLAAALSPTTEVQAEPNVSQNARLFVAETETVQADSGLRTALGRNRVRARPAPGSSSETTTEMTDLSALLIGQPLPAPPPPAPPPPVSADGFSIAVDISIVKLRRPWLSDGLLNLNGWFVPSAAKGSFSANSGAGDPGILPILTVACVLIRNLTIHAQWSEDDQEVLESSSHLGVFGLQGRSYDRNSATMTVLGMQSVAWICDPLPVLPPADAPTA